MPDAVVELARRRSSGSSSAPTSVQSSVHALDMSYDGERGEYRDVDGEAELNSSDEEGRDFGWVHWLRSLMRGRALPLKPLAVTIAWTAVAVTASWALSHGYPPNHKGMCRWWCSPLSIDGDAHAYVGFVRTAVLRLSL